MKFDGGKAVVQRILQAYGFTMQKQLHDHLGVGNGTVSTWIKRNYFPGEVVIRCALETGVDLEWLATGSEIKLKEKVDSDGADESLSIERKQISNGQLIDRGMIKIGTIDLLVKPIDPVFIYKLHESWLIDQGVKKLVDGEWLIEIDSIFSIEKIHKMPNNKINLNGVEWPVENVKTIGIVLAYTKWLI